MNIFAAFIIAHAGNYAFTQNNIKLSVVYTMVAIFFFVKAVLDKK